VRKVKRLGVLIDKGLSAIDHGLEPPGRVIAAQFNRGWARPGRGGQDDAQTTGQP
jgi:hypothetical protein